MKIRLLTAITILALVVMAVPPSAALAGAYETSFVTSITYQNADTAVTTNLRIYFYDSPSDTTPVEIIRPNLNPGASTSLFIGGLTEISPGFRGTAVLASDKRMIATLVQLPQNSTTVKVRPLSNGFASGSANSLIASVLKNQFAAQQYTIFSVQNAGTSATDVAIKFYNTANPPALVHTINTNLQPGAGYFVNTGDVSQLGTGFNGSVVIESTGGSIISSAMELDSNGLGGKAFEGLGAGSTTFYMPSALCNFRVSGQQQNTFYAIQNTSLTTSTNVTVTYSPGGYTQSTTNLGPGAKFSFTTCSASGIPQLDYNGSATVTSSVTPIIALGKASGGGLSTAFVGFISGTAKIGLPYIRWSETQFTTGVRQRANIAIQNVGTVAVAGPILVKYIDPDGNVVGTHTIPTGLAAGAKVSSNPLAATPSLPEFGYFGSVTGGGVVIEAPAGSQLVAIARVTSNVPATGLRASEDYNGMGMP
jgi:hypothetical protein